MIRIKQLPVHIANQIAAGEVIERPASIVKELLENAYDAGADSIDIEVDFGGLNRIKVSDNGCGIYAEDLSLAISAHATSKIAQIEDLFAIETLGFRGEALASIASVSRLTISSKPANQAQAMQLLKQPDGNDKLVPCARTQGTTVEVRDLFFNTPVRKKFLKSAHTEFLAIEAVIKCFAMSAPFIAITLIHNQKQIVSLPPATSDQLTLTRIKKLLGKPFIDHALYLEVAQGTLQLRGWVCTSNYQRSQKDKFWTYINHRMVKDKLLHHAIKQAYEPILHPGRYPACLLYLTLPAQEVDVNVHPTKHEVRFQQPRLIHDFIFSHLNKALSQCTSYETIHPVEKRSLAVHESSWQAYPHVPTDIHQAKSNHFVCLNSKYGILFHTKLPYLVNLHRLQQKRLSHLASKEPTPFSCRNLLVPICYTLTPEQAGIIRSCQALLNTFGVQTVLQDSNQLMIRTVPNILPQLDFKLLLEDLSSVQITHADDLLEQLIQHHFFDALQLTLDEQDELATYFNNLSIQEMFDQSYALLMNETACQEMLYV